MLISPSSKIRSLFVTMIFSAIAACGGGGGGGGGGSVTANPSITIARAYANLIQNGYQVNLAVTGTASEHAVSGSATQTSSPAVAATFEGHNGLANTITVTGTITIENNVLPLTGHFTNYSTSNYLPLGNIDNDDGTYTVVTSSSPLPTSGQVGDTGTLSHSTSYQDQTKTVILNTAVTTYAIEPNDANSAIFHTTEKTYDTGNQLIDTSEERYVVTSSGVISFHSSSYRTADGDFQLNFTPQ